MKTRVSLLACARLSGAVALLTVPAALTAQVTQPAAGAYGFVRTVDGAAYLIEGGTGQRSDVRANEPLLTGDHVFVSSRSRVELLLSDRNIIRLGDRAELELLSLAASPDGQSDQTVVRLRRGTLQFVVVDDFVGGFYPTVETPHASVHLRASGAYVVSADGGHTVVTVRRGAADVITDRGSSAAAAGEELVVDGSGRRDVRYARAGSRHPLERWGDELIAGSYGEEVRYVDAGLAYAAAPLARHGRWVSIGGRYGWYPHHRAGWRPYWKGHWRHTPTGLLWVSYEPWGWVPYHYGLWDHVPGYGWVWFPGHRFAPAWVAWYWGPTYVGWSPLGFYAGYHSSGFRISIGFGTHGWAYGPAHRFRGFTFVPGHKFGRRHQHKWARRGYDLGRSGHVFERGIITTDTRRITPPRWRRPADVVRELDEDGRRRRGGGRLPDVALRGGRVQSLPAEVGRVAVNDGGRRNPERARDRRPADRGRNAADRPGGTERRPPRARAPNRRQPLASSPAGRPPRVTAPERRSPRAGSSGQWASDRRPVVRSPERRARTPAVRSPDSGSRRPTARTPDSGQRRPTARTPSSGSRRPTARTPSSGSRRPTARTPSSGAQRPTARTPSSGAQRPTARSPRPGTRRPTAGSPRPTSRGPTARSPERRDRAPSARTPSRVGPGAERGRVKVTERKPPRAAPRSGGRAPRVGAKPMTLKGGGVTRSSGGTRGRTGTRIGSFGRRR